jgi:hypothetical protein
MLILYSSAGSLRHIDDKIDPPLQESAISAHAGSSLKSGKFCRDLLPVYHINGRGSQGTYQEREWSPSSTAACTSVGHAMNLTARAKSQYYMTGSGEASDPVQFQESLVKPGIVTQFRMK